jgi:enolase
MRWFCSTLAGGTEDALDTIKLSVENAGYTFLVMKL